MEMKDDIASKAESSALYVSHVKKREVNVDQWGCRLEAAADRLPVAISNGELVNTLHLQLRCGELISACEAYIRRSGF
jgi:hypothetical protein